MSLVSAGVDPVRLRRVLGDENLSWLVTRVRTRLERGMAVEGSVSLDGATAAQRQAVARLLGRRPGRGSSLSVSLPSVEQALRRAGLAPDLRSAVEELTGAVPDRAAGIAESEEAWRRAFEPAEAAAAQRPALEQWVTWMRQTGIVRRLAEGDPSRGSDLITGSVAALELLPAGGVPLSVLAARAVGDGHGLDPGRPLATLVLRAAAALGDLAPGDDAESRRTVWAAVGVLEGELTNPVLTLNLPADEGTVTGRALAVWRTVGQPVYLTARQLVRDPPEFVLGGRSVFVCENPAVVAAAADRLGASCAPLVCGSGHPGAAATLLLRMLVSAGATLRYHSDFDWPGVTIANGMVERFGALPWRMDAGDYEAGLRSQGIETKGRATATGSRETEAQSPGTGARGSVAPASACATGSLETGADAREAAPRHGVRELRGTPVAASWEPYLEHAMRTYGAAVEEETVLDDLLHDLAV